MSTRNKTTGYCLFCAFRYSKSLQTCSRPKLQQPKDAISQTRIVRSGPLRSYSSSPRQEHPPQRADANTNLKGLKVRKNLGLPQHQNEFDVKQLADVTQIRLKEIAASVIDSPVLQTLQLDKATVRSSYSKYRSEILASFRKAAQQNAVKGQSAWDNCTFSILRIKDALRKKGIDGLDDHLKFDFYGYLAGSRFSKSELENQVELADLRYPSEWYPRTRRLRRDIHLHVGPTNSGKTYHALKRLEQVSSGAYAGPLRLLAQEVYARMNNAGRRCLLITGEERRSPDKEYTADLISCTVEMMPLRTELDVAVIDEIQMIGSPDRGWAWTQAFMGVNAKEVHLCGEERAVPLIRELTAFIGDELHIHNYKRLSPLEVAPYSLDGKLQNLKKGDCIVSFSVMGIHALKKAVEQATGKKVAIVYGGLPPETRAQQARLFNDPDNDYDFLVASNAIGMGLNLSIKRIIFETVFKFDGQTVKLLSISDIKQIAGRAGRYRTANLATAQDRSKVESALDTVPDEKSHLIEKEREPTAEKSSDQSTTGFVTTLSGSHLPIVKSAMSRGAERIKTAGIMPPDHIVQRFSSYFPPGTPFSYILLRLHEIAQKSSRFHMCDLRDQLLISDTVHPIENLTISERMTLCSAPTSTDPLLQVLIKFFAQCVADQRQCNILAVPGLPLDILDREEPGKRGYLRQLETLHKGINLYIWLSYRFHGVFAARSLAFYAKKLVEGAIERSLATFNFTRKKRSAARNSSEQAILDVLRKELKWGNEEEGGAAATTEGEDGGGEGKDGGAKEVLDGGMSSKGERGGAGTAPEGVTRVRFVPMKEETGKANGTVKRKEGEKEKDDEVAAALGASIAAGSGGGLYEANEPLTDATV